MMLCMKIVWTETDILESKQSENKKLLENVGISTFIIKWSHHYMVIIKAKER